MQHSESIANFAGALAQAQAEIRNALKTSANPHYKSKYADLAEVIDTVKSVFPKHGLSFVQFLVSEQSGAGVETMLMHTSGEWLKSEPCFIPLDKNNAHGFGSATTYARRYSLAAAAGIGQEDDDGNRASETVDANKKGPGEQIAGTSEAITQWETTLKGCLDGEGLAKVWANMPKEIRALKRLQNVKDELKARFVIGMPA